MPDTAFIAVKKSDGSIKSNGNGILKLEKLSNTKVSRKGKNIPDHSRDSK